MTILDGVYRIQNTTTTDTYLTVISTTGQVKGAALLASDPNKTQQWKITRKPDGTCEVVNVGSGMPLGIAPPSGSELEYTLSVAAGSISTAWGLDSGSVGNIVFQAAAPQFNNKVADISDADRIILWERNGLPNQFWVGQVMTLALQWVSASNGSIPDGAVQGGYEADGRPLYVARARIPDGAAVGLQPGKAATHLASVGGCIVGCYQKEYNFSQYEVLVGDPQSYVWVPYTASGPINPSKIIYNGKVMTPVIGGTTSYGSLYSVQGIVSGAQICGKSSNYSGVWLTYNGAEHEYFGAYNVVCYSG